KGKAFCYPRPNLISLHNYFNFCNVAGNPVIGRYDEFSQLKASPLPLTMRLFRLPAPTTKTIGLHPAHGSPIRAVRETVCYVMPLRRPAGRSLMQQQQNCDDYMVRLQRTSGGGRQEDRSR